MSDPTPTPQPTPASPAKKSGAVRTLVILLVVVAFLVGVVGVMAAVLSGSPKTATPVAKAPPGDPVAGKTVTQKFGCITCHSDDGTIIRGPSYKGLFNSRQTYTDGTTGVIDEADVRDALIHPAAKIIDGFEPVMPVNAGLTETDKQNLVAYLWSIGADNQKK